MTREEREKAIVDIRDNIKPVVGGKSLDMAIKALEQERSRLAQITQYRNDCEKLMQENEQLKKALKQEPKTVQFAKWVAEEVIDEELWELNYGAFGEIACRKLEKLGIVKAKGDEWELVESQESEEE